MEVYVGEDGDLTLARIYNGIVLVAEHEALAVTERDGRFEFARLDGPYHQYEGPVCPMCGLYTAAEWENYG